MINWVTLLLAILGIFVGYKLNQYANKQSEDRIIQALKDQIALLQNKQKVTRLTQEEQIRIQGLNEALNILTTKNTKS